jgi:hypothetical protein
MSLSYTTTARNARLDEITTVVGASGILKFYSGTPPANVGASLSGNTLLAQLTMNATFAPPSSGGVLTLNSIATESSADATGTASFFRMTTSGGTAEVQGTVGTSGADLNLNTTSIVAGAAVSVSSFTITEGNP